MKSNITIAFFLVITILCKTNFTHAQIKVQDSLALVDLYDSTNGPGWLHNDNWLTGPVGSWYGIDTSGNRVGSIALNDNNLSGRIPLSFGNLSFISNLNLEHNQITGIIPSSFRSLDSLTNLNLGNNQLSGRIPSSLGNLSLLVFLSLDSNQFSGRIPGALGRHLVFNSLYLQHNNLSGKIPFSLTHAIVNNLDLSNNQLTFSGMENIARIYSFAIYAPQADISLHRTGNTLYVSAGGTPANNTYHWYKENLLDTIINADSTFMPKSDGKYSVFVTNLVATKLTLYSDTSSFVLPLSLLSFTAIKNGKVNLLQWTTTQEINTSHFNVQRSYDGVEFTNIGTVQAKNISNVTNNYQYTDTEPLSGKNYYRLEIMDKDGYTEYSAIRTINVAAVASQLYPNPAANYITISFNSNVSQPAQVEIISLDGKVQKTMRMSLAPGYNNQVVELGYLIPGPYIVTVSSLHKILLSKKFIKE
jgi:hypothetical protein